MLNKEQDGMTRLVCQLATKAGAVAGLASVWPGHGTGLRRGNMEKAEDRFPDSWRRKGSQSVNLRLGIRYWTAGVGRYSDGL